jgi:hypothetical protein
LYEINEKVQKVANTVHIEWLQMKLTGFWQITVWNLTHNYQPSNWTCYLHLKARNVSQSWKLQYSYRERQDWGWGSEKINMSQGKSVL